MSLMSPFEILAAVSAAVPADCRENIIIIGSLAAGYHYFGQKSNKDVRTKDVDCLLAPFDAAVLVGQHIFRQLTDAGWKKRATGHHHVAGTESTPTSDLPAVRLYPPETDPESVDAWFIELLAMPEGSTDESIHWTRLVMDEGHYGLPSFRFLSVVAHDPLPAGSLGMRYARPEMMALANLLMHPVIKPERMSALFVGRSIRRSNKDLGRVLAIAYLADLEDYRPWGVEWQMALKASFPDEWRVLALRTGEGLRALLRSENDLSEAHYTCVNGLLASQPPARNALHTAGERLLGEAVWRLEQLAAE